MKKVLYVFGGEKASGAEIVIERLISYNLRHVEPHLVLSPGKFADNLIAANKPYSIVQLEDLRKLNRSRTGTIGFLIKAIKNYFSVSSFVISYIKKNRIDIVHANTVVPASYLVPAIIYSKLFLRRKQWVWSDHDLKYFSKLDTLLSNLCVSLYNKTLAVSYAVKAKYEENSSVGVLYNGLDTEIFKNNPKARLLFRAGLGLEDQAIVLGIAATISPRKGQLEFIKVFKELNKKHLNLVLLLAGGLGEDDNTYNLKVNDAINGSPNIKYIGHVANMINYYLGCDIIVNNSNIEGSEPLGTTIYEAMACERIVLASAVGGTPEIVSDSVDGFTFEPIDSAGLANKLEFIISNLSKLDSVRFCARRKVVDKFNLNLMVDKYNNIIESK